MKRTRFWLVAVGLGCTPLVACSDYRSTDVTFNSRVEVSAAGATHTDTRVGAIRLGAGDEAGDMLHDYYLAHFQEQRQPDEEIVLHGDRPAVDPSP